MDEKLFHILLTIIPVLGTLLSYFAVPYLKAIIGSEKLEQYTQWAALAVKCAEMLMSERGEGINKKQYVIRFLDRMFNSRKKVLTQEQMDVLIEAAVQEMNQNREKERARGEMK